ncbi:MAG: hypothetical protein PVG30_05455 [Gammaproteobacteria bacterium]|jgi:hypothetical protein
MMTDHLTADQDYLSALAHLNLAEKFAGVWQNNKKSSMVKETQEFSALIQEVVEGIRELEYEIISEYNNQIWKISSSLLLAFERLQNLGISQLREGNRQVAQEHFTKAHDLYNLFCELHQKLSEVQSTKAKETKADEQRAKKSGKIVGKLKDLVQKVIDCCIE